MGAQLVALAVLVSLLIGAVIVWAWPNRPAADGTARSGTAVLEVGLAFLVLVPLTTAAATLAAWLLVGRRHAGLRQITRFVRRIGPERLDRRLSGVGAGELGAVAAELNRMLARLQDSFQAHDRFVGEVSHELKTPVSILLLEAQVLMRSPPDAGAHARFVASVEEEMRRLGKLIESFLALARAGQANARLPRMAVDMNASAMEAGRCCWALARLREVRLAITLAGDDRFEDGPVVDGDPELLRTLIDNLLRNAVMIAPRNSTVDLRVALDGGVVI